MRPREGKILIGFSAVSLLIILLLLLSGCDLFDTRNPENPGGVSNIWNPPVVPRDVLDNIAEAFQLHDASLYMKSFANPSNSDSGFKFYPDLSAIGYDSALFSDWGYYQENAFILNLFSPAFLPLDSTAYIEFIAENEPPGEDNPIYRESYYIQLGLLNEENLAEYGGKVYIHFDRDFTGVWVITAWEDEKTSQYLSMTELKYTTSN